jgi:hypothetical protein
MIPSINASVKRKLFIKSVFNVISSIPKFRISTFKIRTTLLLASRDRRQESTKNQILLQTRPRGFCICFQTWVGWRQRAWLTWWEHIALKRIQHHRCKERCLSTIISSIWTVATRLRCLSLRKPPSTRKAGLELLHQDLKTQLSLSNWSMSMSQMGVWHRHQWYRRVRELG